MRLESPYDKDRKRKHKKKLQTNIHWEYKCKSPSTKYYQTGSSCIIKGLCTMTQWDLSQDCKSDSTYNNHYTTLRE
jgi:hypothetical protein